MSGDSSQRGPSPRPETVAVAAGRGRPVPGSGLNVPVHFASAYRAGDAGGAYAREHNPTWEAFEEVVGALEGGRAVAFASGMAAVAAVVDGVETGAVVVAPYDAYAGVRALLDDLGARGRCRPRLVDPGDHDALARACVGAALLWLESPTNPLLRVIDLERATAIARSAGALVAVDNTFATPLRQRPLELGADVVVHSATKLLAGHSDLLLGVAVSTRDELTDQLVEQRTLHGAVPGPMEAYLALRGLRSLPVRLDRGEANAREVAARLEAHGDVQRVRYPGFATVVSFEPAGGAARADGICERLSLVTHATSLGGIETTIERRARMAGEAHVPDALLRLSVGCEHVDDLWADLAAALAATG